MSLFYVLIRFLLLRKHLQLVWILLHNRYHGFPLLLFVSIRDTNNENLQTNYSPFHTQFFVTEHYCLNLKVAFMHVPILPHFLDKSKHNVNSDWISQNSCIIFILTSVRSISNRDPRALMVTRVTETLATLISSQRGSYLHFNCSLIKWIKINNSKGKMHYEPLV